MTYNLSPEMRQKISERMKRLWALGVYKGRTGRGRRQRYFPYKYNPDVVLDITL